MKNLHVLVAEEDWAKLYKSECPPEQLTLIYHQRQLSSHAAERDKTRNIVESPGNRAMLIDDNDFAKSLCKVLQLECLAGRFDGLVVISKGDCLAIIYQHMSIECRSRTRGVVLQAPRELSEADVLAKVKHLADKDLNSIAAFE